MEKSGAGLLGRQVACQSPQSSAHSLSPLATLILPTPQRPPAHPVILPQISPPSSRKPPPFLSRPQSHLLFLHSHILCSVSSVTCGSGPWTSRPLAPSAGPRLVTSYSPGTSPDCLKWTSHFHVTSPAGLGASVKDLKICQVDGKRNCLQLAHPRLQILPHPALSFGLEGRKCKELRGPVPDGEARKGEGPARAAPRAGRSRTRPLNS